MNIFTFQFAHGISVSSTFSLTTRLTASVHSPLASLNPEVLYEMYGAGSCFYQDTGHWHLPLHWWMAPSGTRSKHSARQCPLHSTTAFESWAPHKHGKVTPCSYSSQSLHWGNLWCKVCTGLSSPITNGHYSMPHSETSLAQHVTAHSSATPIGTYAIHYICLAPDS